MTQLDVEDSGEEKPRRGRCRICRHKLQDPVSQAYGIGPDCRAALGLTKGPRLIRLTRVRAGGHVPGQEDLLAGEE
ncbi:DUF6011 domain-containing protein [Streptosporangium sp. NPDC000239]|uniref:DUF6011 domain-containing protein n=1 Tax=Streptosporangium sp. NPDC000239 TaxID=3154248 RepID=UPI00332B459E